jgi:hypothetical protein
LDLQVRLSHGGKICAVLDRAREKASSARANISHSGMFQLPRCSAQEKAPSERSERGLRQQASVDGKTQNAQNVSRFSSATSMTTFRSASKAVLISIALGMFAASTIAHDAATDVIGQTSVSPLRNRPDSRQTTLQAQNATAELPGSEEAAQIRGVATVLDTGTLRIAGQIVLLFGVVPVGWIGAEQLAQYLGKEEVVCWPVGSLRAFHRCHARGHDLSAVVLFNGGGRTTPDATPQLVAAENHARSARIGVWSDRGLGDVKD